MRFVGIVIKNGKVSIYSDALNTINFPATVDFKKNPDSSFNDGCDGVVTGYIEMLNTEIPIPSLKPLLSLTHKSNVPKFEYSFKVNDLQYTVDTETILIRLLTKIKEIISEEDQVALAIPQNSSEECQKAYLNLAESVGLNIYAVIKELDGSAFACRNAKVVECDAIFAIVDITPLSVNIGVYKNGTETIISDAFFMDENFTEETFENEKIKFFDEILRDAKERKPMLRNNFNHFENYVDSILKAYQNFCNSKQISRIILNCNPILRDIFKQKFLQLNLKFIFVNDFESLIAKGVIDAAISNYGGTVEIPSKQRNQNRIKGKIPLSRMTAKSYENAKASSESDSDDE